MVLYYDFRLDHTLGLYTPNTPFEPDPSNQGKLYKEKRMPEGSADAVFTPFVDDLGLTRRHTVDVMVAQAQVPAVPGQPAFTSPARVSQYIFGLRSDPLNLNPNQIQQLQENPPNLKLFAMGTSRSSATTLTLPG